MITYQTLEINNNDLDVFRNYIQQNETNAEYKYWFSDKKFKNSNVCNIEAAFLDDKIISISACTYYDSETLRIAQFHYTLPKYRKHRNFMIDNNGFIKRHIDTARINSLPKLIVAIHSFNHKTSQMLNVWLNRRHKIKWF